MNLRNFVSASSRRQSLESELNVKLSNIGSFSFDENIASTKNCENMIGGAQLPIGVAGPLKINGESFNGQVYIPLATTEGALVASVNRGCKAITESGGVTS